MWMRCLPVPTVTDRLPRAAAYTAITTASGLWLSPDIVLQRLFAAAPDSILIAPVWNKTRSELLRDLDVYMEKNGSYQGKQRP